MKLADGTWLAGDKADGSPADWLVTEIALADVRWIRLDPEKLVTKGVIVDRPDLTKVDEVGFVESDAEQRTRSGRLVGRRTDRGLRTARRALSRLSPGAALS